MQCIQDLLEDDGLLVRYCVQAFYNAMIVIDELLQEEAIGLANPITEEVFRARTNKKLLQANQAVEELAARYGAEFKNLNSGITDETGNLKAEYTVEGMHIYPDGYRQVWDQLKDELMQLSYEP